MSWTLGNYTIAAGASIVLGYEWGDRNDRGPQWVVATPRRGAPPAKLVVRDHYEQSSYRIAGVTGGGDSVYQPADTEYHYGLTVENRSSNTAEFVLQGGRAG